jgi:hypothetical protein
MREPDDDNWRLDAKCHGQDLREYVTELLPQNPRVRRLIAQGKCSGCPVFDRCGEEALRNKDRGVIMAGEALDGTPGLLLWEQHDRIRERLGMERVMPVSDSEDEVQTTWPRPCKTCGQAMRPRTEKETGWDGTVPSHTRSICRACYKVQLKENGLEVDRYSDYPRPCHTCGAPMRPRLEPMDEEKWPETVRANTRNECHTCNVRRRKLIKMEGQHA